MARQLCLSLLLYFYLFTRHSFFGVTDSSILPLAALPPVTSQYGLLTDPATSNSLHSSLDQSVLVHSLTRFNQSLSALGPDMYTTLPSIIASPLKTLRRHRLAHPRAEGNTSATILQPSSRQYSQAHVCHHLSTIFEPLTKIRDHPHPVYQIS